MIATYTRHGHSKEVLPMLRLMQREGMPPTLTTFRAILSACGHAGLVDDAQSCLNSMSEVYGVEPDTEHDDCVVDLLGRAGRVDEVQDMMLKMPVQPSLVSWVTLLGACSSQADVAWGETVPNQVFELFPDCPVPYVMLSNMYVEAGMDVDAERLLARMKGKGLMKQEDCSYININGTVHGFFVAGCQPSHPEAESIFSELQRLVKLSEDARLGLMLPQDTLVMDHGICHHTKRLAMACGTLSTSRGIAIFIAKSVKMCSCCHAFLKCISKLCNRPITVIDECLFHRMEDGSCSCGA